MQQFLKDHYNLMVSSIEEQIKSVEHNTEEEVGDAKRQKENDVVLPKFNEIIDNFNKLATQLRAETEQKIETYRQEAEKAKLDFQNKVYGETEAAVRAKNALTMQKLKEEIDFIKNRIDRA